MVGIPINVRSALGAAETAINHPAWFVVCLHGTKKSRPGGKSWTEKPRSWERLTRHKTCGGRDYPPSQASAQETDAPTARRKPSHARRPADSESQPSSLSMKDGCENNECHLSKNLTSILIIRLQLTAILICDYSGMFTQIQGLLLCVVHSSDPSGTSPLSFITINTILIATVCAGCCWIIFTGRHQRQKPHVTASLPALNRCTLSNRRGCSLATSEIASVSFGGQEGLKSFQLLSTLYYKNMNGISCISGFTATSLKSGRGPRTSAWEANSCTSSLILFISNRPELRRQYSNLCLCADTTLLSCPGLQVHTCSTTS